MEIGILFALGVFACMVVVWLALIICWLLLGVVYMLSKVVLPFNFCRPVRVRIKNAADQFGKYIGFGKS